MPKNQKSRYETSDTLKHHITTDLLFYEKMIEISTDMADRDKYECLRNLVRKYKIICENRGRY